jgi:hypothetical protein
VGTTDRSTSTTDRSPRGHGTRGSTAPGAGAQSIGPEGTGGTRGPRSRRADVHQERAIRSARYQALAERAAAMALEDAVAAATTAPELARQRLTRAREARRRAAEQDALVEQLSQFA